MGLKGRANFTGWICPFYSSVEAFGILPEDDHIHPRLLEAPVRRAADEVQGIAGEGPAGSDTQLQIKVLPQADDWAVIDEPLILELWRDLGGTRSVLLEDWPSWDEAALVREEITLVITVNGKVRSKVTVLAGASEAEVRDAALAEPRLVQILAGRTPKKVIVVPGRLVNVVV